MRRKLTGSASTAGTGPDGRTRVGGAAAAAPPGEAVAAVQLDYDPMPGLGSNAIALGSELTASGKGILFGNPHYPWHGPARFHMIHTTIPGKLDTMGASLLSGSFVAIGFNKDIAWTHTVSTALRMTLFELELNPDNPLQYRHGDRWRDIERIDVTVPLVDGESRRVRLTLLREIQQIADDFVAALNVAVDALQRHFQRFFRCPRRDRGCHAGPGRNR